MLGEPAFVAPEHRSDAQREALLSEQGVAAVARAERNDLASLWEVDDVLVLRVARPSDVLLAALKGLADRVQARHELAVTEYFEGAGAHARHDLHAHRDVGRVGDLDTDVTDLRTEGAHGEGHHVHGAPLHASAKESVELGAHLFGVTPVVRGTSVDLLLRADVRAVFDASNVTRVREGVVTVGTLLGVQSTERSGFDETLAEFVVFGLGSVAPVDTIRGGDLCY